MTNPIIRLREALAQGPSFEQRVWNRCSGAVPKLARQQAALIAKEADDAIRSLLSTNDELRSKLEAAERESEILRTWARQVSERMDVPQGIRYAATQLAEARIKQALGATNTKGTR